MFTWICPKCGTEVPPSYSECPKCASASAEVKPAEAEAAEAKPAENAAAPPPASTPPAAPAKTAGGPPAAAAPPPKKRTARPWLQSLIGALAMLVIVMAVLVVVRSGAFRRQAPTPPAASGLAALENAGALQADPVLKNIEITGFRLSEEKDRKPMLRFVVVNHSAADVGEIKAKADLRARTAATTDEPVASFEFTTRLGPYEAQDIRVPLETKLRAYELPDWQLLRADLSRQ